MKILIVEDDAGSRLLIKEILKPHGQVHTAANGKQAVAAVDAALQAGAPYDLICLDIMMPEMDGQQALREIRTLEEARGIFSSDGSKIIMTTALADMKNISTSYMNLCDAYLPKPIEKTTLLKQLHALNLIP